MTFDTAAALAEREEGISRSAAKRRAAYKNKNIAGIGLNLA